MNESSAQIEISATRIANWLAAVIALFIAIASANQVARWLYGVDDSAAFIRLFDVEAEKNPPALFAGLQLLLAAGILWLIQRQETLPWRRMRWRILGIGLAWIAFDEVFWMHERLIEPMRSLLGDGDLGAFTYAWVVPASVLVLFLAVYFAPLLLSLPNDTRNRLVLSGGLFIIGAVGMEMVGGWYWSTHGNDLMQSMIVIVEEALEFAGICLFIHTALRYLNRADTVTTLRFTQ